MKVGERSHSSRTYSLLTSTLRDRTVAFSTEGSHLHALRTALQVLERCVLRL